MTHGPGASASVAAVDPEAQRAKRIAAIGYDYTAQALCAVERCNLCGGSERRIVARRDRYGFPASAAGCERCGLVFLDPMLSRDAYAEFYERWYRPLVSAHHGRRIDARTLPAEQRAYAESLVAWLGPRLGPRPPATLLDVGGSTGVVAAALRDRFGAAATVLDPAPAELEVAQRLGLDTAAGFIEQYQPADGRRFELIALCQTADHLLDVAGALARIRSLVAPGGWFFVDIVDYRAVARARGSVEAAIKLDHPYSLSDATLRAYLARAGFEVRDARAAADHHLAYLCAPCAPQPGALPDPGEVAATWSELDSTRLVSR
jgi:SAM-dependent methyltransferase